MNEYIIKVRIGGKLQVHRVWGYNNSDAKTRLKNEIGSYSTVSSRKA